jgi:hypothetical protein
LTSAETWNRRLSHRWTGRTAAWTAELTRARVRPRKPLRRDGVQLSWPAAETIAGQRSTSELRVTHPPPPPPPPHGLPPASVPRGDLPIDRELGPRPSPSHPPNSGPPNQKGGNQAPRPAFPPPEMPETRAADQLGRACRTCRPARRQSSRRWCGVDVVGALAAACRFRADRRAQTADAAGRHTLAGDLWCSGATLLVNLCTFTVRSKNGRHDVRRRGRIGGVYIPCELYTLRPSGSEGRPGPCAHAGAQ